MFEWGPVDGSCLTDIIIRKNEPVGWNSIYAILLSNSTTQNNTLNNSSKLLKQTVIQT